MNITALRLQDLIQVTILKTEKKVWPERPDFERFCYERFNNRCHIHHGRG